MSYPVGDTVSSYPMKAELKIDHFCIFLPYYFTSCCGAIL